MADEYDESPYEGFSYEDTQEFLYDVIGFTGESHDDYAHSLFWDAYYNDDLTIDERIEKLEELQDYLYDEYDLMFLDYWDWDDFREWYALQ